MSKPKNEPEVIVRKTPSLLAIKIKAYEEGFRDGEKRLARALRRWFTDQWIMDDGINKENLINWLTARLKRGKK